MAGKLSNIRIKELPEIDLDLRVFELPSIDFQLGLQPMRIHLPN